MEAAPRRVVQDALTVYSTPNTRLKRLWVVACACVVVGGVKVILVVFPTALSFEVFERLFGLQI